MRFLLDANLPRQAGTTIRGLGHECLDVRDLGMGGATDTVIAAYAKTHRLVLISRDFDFADIRNYPPNEYSGLVVVDLPDTAHSRTICSLLAFCMSNQELLDQLPGRLAVIAPGRIRLRSSQ